MEDAQLNLDYAKNFVSELDHNSMCDDGAGHC